MTLPDPPQDETDARQLIADVLEERADELTKEACDNCEDCGALVMGKLALIGIVTPLTTLGPIAFGNPDFLVTAFFCDIGLIVGLVGVMAWYADRHPFTANLEGPDMVKVHLQQIRNNSITGGGAGIEVEEFGGESAYEHRIKDPRVGILDELSHRLDALSALNDRLITERDKAKDSLAALRVTLREYGQHKATCARAPHLLPRCDPGCECGSWDRWTHTPCDCGWASRLASLDALTGGQNGKSDARMDTLT